MTIIPQNTLSAAAAPLMRNARPQAHADRGEELTHWRRKAETSEKEVKRLRARIEELKKDLARAEDQMDESANSIR